MRKITIEGEVFSYDETSHSLAEAIEVEEALGMSYGRYQEGLAQGSAKADAAFLWMVMRRNGRDVPLEDIITGKFPVDMAKVKYEAEGEENPTQAGPSSGTTDGPTSGSSPKSSATPPAKPTP